MTTPDTAHLSFALRTHARLREEPRDGDLLWSPYSVVAALGLVAAGARGRTRDELAEYLAPGAGVDDLLTRVRDAASLEDDREDESGLAVANTLWTRPGLPVEPAYEGLVRDVPGGALRTADFKDDPAGAAAAINDDVAKTTRGLIRSIVDRGAVDGMDAVLVNALWVYLAWIDRFAVDATSPLTFHTPDGERRVPAMRAQKRMAIARVPGWRMVTLPGHGGLAMDVLLPDDPGALPSAREMAALYDGAGSRQVRLALPRFEVEYGQEMGGVVAALGAPAVFTDHADLSGISPVPLKIDQILHKARLRADEAGVEGAAATAVMMVRTAAISGGPVDFTVDRPFLAVVRHRTSAMIYFLAEITDPADPGPAST